MNHLLVTGGTGFLGRPIVERLRSRGVRVSVLSSRIEDPAQGIFRCDLLQSGQTAELLQKLRPDGLLHLAWEVDHATYLTTEKNLDWTAATLFLLRAFAQSGGHRAVIAGTCLEYEQTGRPLHETSTRISPQSLYASAKAGCGITAQAYARQTGLSLCWLRYFYLFGAGERYTRAVPQAILSLLRDQPVVCRSAQAVRDYLFLEDAAEATVRALFSRLEGALNLCSGRGITMGELFGQIAQKLDRQTLVSYQEEPVSPLRVVGDAQRLEQELGFIPRPLEEGLDETIWWWKHRIERGG